MRQPAGVPVPRRRRPLERVAEAVVLIVVGGLCAALLVFAAMMAAG